MADKRLHAGRAAEHRLQIWKRGQRIEIGMHKGEVFDIRQFSRIGPNTNFQIRKLLRKGVAPCLRVADTLVEIDEEQRHDVSYTSQPRPACARALSKSGTLLADATSPSRDPRVTVSAATAASFSVILAMMASLARSKTPRLVATKCCDSRSLAR